MKEGYKESALGLIPEDWVFITLKDACIKIQDGNYGGEYPKPDEFFDSGIPFLTSKAIGGEGEIIEDKIDFISEEKHRQLKKAHLKMHDVLFTNRGANVGTIGLVDERIAYGNIGPQLTLLRADSEKVHFLFLKEVIKSAFVQNQVRSQDSGSAMNFFGIGDTSKFKFPLPPLPEQRAIAAILSKMDDAIQKNNQLIAQKELRKKWLMQNLLTGKKRLKGFDGEWKEKKLSDLFERVTRKNIERNTTVVTISAQRGFVRQTDFFNKNIASEITDNYFLVENGEFCYNKSYSNGYPWGATKRLSDFEKAVVTTLYICFGIKDKAKTNGDFFEQYFDANYLDKGLTKIAHEGGRAHGLLNVTPSDFFSLKINVPDYKEQTAIAEILQASNNELQLLKSKSEKLKEQKKGMMQLLLTGKKRLKN